MTYIFTIFLVILYSFFAIFLARMGGRISASLGVAIFSIISGVLSLIYYLYERFVRQVVDAATTPTGLFYAVAAGIVIAVWNVLVVLLFSKGGNLSYVFPLVYGAGAVAVPSLVGWLVFGEKVSALQASGILLILLGFVVVLMSTRHPAGI